MKNKFLLFRHPRRSIMSKCYNISSGDPELDYLSLFRIKDSRILKNTIDSRSKAYRLCSLLCGGNDGVRGRFYAKKRASI